MQERLEEAHLQPGYSISIKSCLIEKVGLLYKVHYQNNLNSNKKYVNLSPPGQLLNGIELIRHFPNFNLANL